MTVRVHSAAIQDRDGGKTVLKASRARYPFVERAFADGGYAGRLVKWAKDKTHIVVEVVRRSPGAEGFEGSCHINRRISQLGQLGAKVRPPCSRFAKRRTMWFEALCNWAV